MKYIQTENVATINAAIEMVNEFAINFKARFGVSPHVYYNLKEGYNSNTILKLTEVFDICDAIYKKNIGSEILAEKGLNSKSRDRISVLYRQSYFKIAKTMNYSLASIASKVDRDHSTAIHGIRIIDELLITNTYEDVNNIYNDLNDAVQTALYFKRRTQLVPETQAFA